MPYLSEPTNQTLSKIYNIYLFIYVAMYFASKTYRKYFTLIGSDFPHRQPQHIRPTVFAFAQNFFLYLAYCNYN